MLWITSMVVLVTVFTVMQENFGPRKGWRATVWFFFVVALGLVIAVALRAGRDGLGPLAWLCIGGAVLALLLDRVGLVLIDFVLEVGTGWKRRKADRVAKAKRQVREAERSKADIAALFARHGEGSGKEP